MSFLQRFKGKTSVIDKEGIDGIVKQKALPIQKQFGNENSDIANQLNNRSLQSQESQSIKPFKPSNMKKASSHHVTHSDMDMEYSSQFSQLNEKPKTKIITNIRQPQENLTSSSAQPQFQHKSASQVRSPKITGSSQSTAASASQFKRNNEQMNTFSQVASLVESNNKEFNNGYDYKPKIHSHNSLSTNLYNNNGSVSTESFKYKPYKSKVRTAEDYNNIFQNRLQQRVFSGALHQPAQPILFSTGNYENEFRSLNYDQRNQGDSSPLNFTGSYKLPKGINSIIVPEDYELIAVPRNQMISINSSVQNSQIKSGYNSGNTSSRLRLPLIGSNSQNLNQQYSYMHNNDSLSQMVPYSSQSISYVVPEDSSYSNKFNGGLSQMVSKKSLVNNGKSIIESTPILKPLKPPGHSTFRYELDFMEEKHRDIIDNLEKIREKRIKK